MSEFPKDGFLHIEIPELLRWKGTVRRKVTPEDESEILLEQMDLAKSYILAGCPD
jgi:hypothetical protein